MPNFEGSHFGKPETSRDERAIKYDYALGQLEGLADAIDKAIKKGGLSQPLPHPLRAFPVTSKMTPEKREENIGGNNLLYYQIVNSPDLSEKGVHFDASQIDELQVINEDLTEHHIYTPAYNSYGEKLLDLDKKVVVDEHGNVVELRISVWPQNMLLESFMSRLREQNG